MSDFTLSPSILAVILCNAPPLVFQPPPPLLIIIAQSLTWSEQLPRARVTAFSRTSLFLEQFWREF